MIAQGALPPDLLTALAALFLLFGVPLILFGLIMLYTGYVQYDGEQYVEELEEEAGLAESSNEPVEESSGGADESSAPAGGTGATADGTDVRADDADAAAGGLNTPDDEDDSSEP